MVSAHVVETFTDKSSFQNYPYPGGRIATLGRSHMNGLIPSERTIEQTTETMSLAPKQ